MRVGDYIRAGQFEAADDLAGALLSNVAGSPDAAERIRLWLEAHTGRTLGDGFEIREMTFDAWYESWLKWKKSGGISL